MTAAVAAHHLCQADNAATCSVSSFVTSLAAQLGQAPALALGYSNALCSAPGTATPTPVSAGSVVTGDRCFG